MLMKKLYEAAGRYEEWPRERHIRTAVGHLDPHILNDVGLDR